jgi:signal transduction histidine kinase
MGRLQTSSIRHGSGIPDASSLKIGQIPPAPLEGRMAEARLVLAMVLLGLAAAGLHANPGVATPWLPIALAYALFALVVRFGAERIGLAYRPALAGILHGVDLLALAAFMFVAAPLVAGFLVQLYLLCVAALRWRRQGLAWMALLQLVVAASAQSMAASGSGDPGPGIGRIASEAVQIGGLACLLWMLAAPRSPAGWTRVPRGGWAWPSARDREALLREQLDQTARALGVPSLTLCWEEGDEPWFNLAVFDGNRLQLGRLQDSDCDTLAPAGWEAGALISPHGDQRLGGFVLIDAHGHRQVSHDPIPGWLRSRLGSGAILSAPVRGDWVDGRLFCIAPRAPESESLWLGELLGRQVALELELQTLRERQQGEDAAGDRVRIARDLHDGVIQSLVAASLRLESARQCLRERPMDAKALLGEAAQILVNEQRELREIVAALDSADGDGPRGGQDFAGRLAAIAEQLASYWNIRVEIDNRAGDGTIPGGLGHQLGALVQEAVVNASRHGHARHVRVGVRLDAGAVHMEVADDGSGFPFTGLLTLEQLKSAGLGPRSLLRRIQMLGGDLRIRSSPAGATLLVRVPTKRHLPAPFAPIEGGRPHAGETGA